MPKVRETVLQGGGLQQDELRVRNADLLHLQEGGEEGGRVQALLPEAALPAHGRAVQWVPAV